MTKFLFYEDWWKVVIELPSELRLQVYDALTSYAFEGKQPTSEMVQYITALMRSTIDRDSAKWEEIKEKRSEAGRRGGLKRAENQANQANANFVKQSQANEANQPININSNMNRNITMNRDSNESNKEKNILKKESEFIPPTVEEVSAYCKERDNGIDAETFVAHYEAIGWMVGRAKMKNWKQAVITWEKRNKANAKPTNLGYGEFIDNNGRRTYADGEKTVPMEAPPRPSRDYWWNTRENRWDNNWI